MDVVSLGVIKEGAEVFFSADALKADHIVVINRVKPHTVFRGDVESGLCKMLAVGCGKKKGAANMHKYDLAQTIIPAAHLILQKAPLLFGIAVTETADGQTHSLKAARPEDFITTDSTLLKTAYKLLPQIPSANIDLLIVDEMGKNISGPGMDTNVIGFWKRDGGEQKPYYRYIAVLDITDESHGNATGIGMADITTKHVFSKINWTSTYLNSITAGILRNGSCPVVAENDNSAIETVLSMLPENNPPKIARIKNTLNLTSLWVTESLLPELREISYISIEDEKKTLMFDTSGKIKPME